MLLLPLLGMACKNTDSTQVDPATRLNWSAAHQVTLTGFDVPECTLHDAASGLIYVSNVESAPDEYWMDDGTSYLSIIGPDNNIRKQRWLNSTEQAPIHGAKGMCILGDFLYFTDNTRLMRCDASTGKGLHLVVSGFQKANDLVSDGKNIWLSDNAAGKVFCISPDGEKREIPAPAGANGLAFGGEKLYVVSWDLHEVYELDPKGKKEPVPFGLADHFTNLDGIEVLCDGSFIVSDFKGNKVSLISKDRKQVKTLIEISTPADIGLDRKKHLLYVPQFLAGKVAVYQLTHGK